MSRGFRIGLGIFWTLFCAVLVAVILLPAFSYAEHKGHWADYPGLSVKVGLIVGLGSLAIYLLPFALWYFWRKFQRRAA